MIQLFENTPGNSSWPRYQHIIFDCDSTLSRIEGIDELARHPQTRRQVVNLTTSAMEGEQPLDRVYKKRLDIIAPTRGAVRRLKQRYLDNRVPGTDLVIETLLQSNCDVYIVSGGLLEPVVEFGVSLGIPAANIRAVDLEYDELSGKWWEQDFDTLEHTDQQRFYAYRQSELAESNGKSTIISTLLRDQDGLSLLIGDGISDLLAMDKVDLFVGFGGVSERERVRNKAPLYFSHPNLLPLLPIALGSTDFYKLNKSIQETVLAELESVSIRFNRKSLAKRFNDCFAV